jgi:hypothetical protein
MIFIVRDFNTPTNDIGEMIAYLSTDIHHNKMIAVDILNLHDLGQAWIRIKYDISMNLYDTILSILNTLTVDIFQEKLEKGQVKGIYKVAPEYTGRSITPEYKDIICLDEPFENSLYSKYWGKHFTVFTRESIALLEEYDDGDKEESYIVYGEILENGEFIYNKPILSNDYYENGSCNTYNLRS